MERRRRSENPPPQKTNNSTENLVGNENLNIQFLTSVEQ
jgi:hypothetical protein